ncbi:MAG: TIGR04552 family protein [Bacteriovoracaceae bacterium]
MTKIERPQYLEKYLFEWETLDVMLSGKSSLDAKRYLGSVKDKENVENFLKGYGFDPANPVLKAELFGNYQEALQFIKRYFLKEGNPDGLDVKVPNSLYSITDIGDLFYMASGKSDSFSLEDSIWAGIVLKVMHTILHADRDLRSHYFTHIQKQIFDRFYRYVHRENDQVYLRNDDGSVLIPLVDFQTKSKKSRESIVIKLLHKVENVAEELFDKIGIRIITRNRSDCLRVVKFLQNNYIVLAHNVKPSRSINSLIDLKKFRKYHFELIKEAMNGNITEDQFLIRMEQNALRSRPEDNEQALVNKHTSFDYRSMQFTCRQLIQYRNPFISEFNQLRKLAKETGEDSVLAKKIIQMDTSSISRDAMFFYPFEVQIQDMETFKRNSEGDASHLEYKKAQVQTAMKRVFKTLIEHKNLEIH